MHVIRLYFTVTSSDKSLIDLITLSGFLPLPHASVIYEYIDQ